MALTNKHLLEQILTSKDMNKEQIDLLIKSFLFENTKDEKVKFDIFKFCGKSYAMPQIEGVYHEKGYKIATDAICLVVIKDPYIEAYERKIIDKNGKVIDRDYVDYNSAKTLSNTPVSFDIKKAKDLIKKDAINKKVNKNDSTSQEVTNYAKIGELIFSIDVLKKIVSLISILKTYKAGINIGHYHSVMLIDSECGSWGVFVAMILKDGHNGAITEL